VLVTEILFMKRMCEDNELAVFAEGKLKKKKKRKKEKGRH